jgi:hypothetical protein
MMIHESAHMQSARKELEALRTAHDASLLLHDVLTGLSGPAEDWATPRGRQKIAVGFLSAISLRSSRASMGIIGWGYVPEAMGLKRRIGEALWRTEKVINDQSGEYARIWIDGKPPSGGMRVPELWRVYSAGTHADIRMMGLEVAEVAGMKRMTVPILPTRQADIANGMLTEIAVEVLDQAAIAVEWVLEREFTDDEQRCGDKIVEAIERLRIKYFDGVSEPIEASDGEASIVQPAP